MTDAPKQYRYKPCPFCGSNDLCRQGISQASVYRAVMCIDCMSHGSYQKTEEQALAAWNKRDYERVPVEQAAQGWMPIDEAPKDGTHILLWAEGYPRPLEGHWESNRVKSAGWYDHIGNEYFEPPTYFMPLPKPPAGDKK